MSLISLNFVLPFFFYDQYGLRIKEQTRTISLHQENIYDEWVKEPHEDEQWIDNSKFKGDEGWSDDKEGDIRDIDTDIDDEEAQYILSGESHTFTALEGTIDNSTGPYYWKNNTHPDIPAYPTKDFKYIEGKGLYASHNWTDRHTIPDPYKLDGHQRASVQWDKIIETQHDMSNYNITTANLEVKVNATVKATPRRWDDVGPGEVGGIEIYGDEGTSGGAIRTGDYIVYYIQLSDIDKNRIFTIAQYKPLGLGNDTAGDWDYLNDTIFGPEFKEDLIFYLNQVLDVNYNYFIITLGMEFFCEDNAPDGAEWDFFKDVLIKACNFSFSYEKLINKETTASWTYEGDEINDKGGRVEIIDSKLQFDYKINSKRLDILSPNSYIKVLIDNKEHSEVVKISEAERSFEEASEDGFDVTDLIPTDDNIDVEIQLYLGDDFALVEGEEYVVSIDNVELYITYDIYLSAEQSLIFQILLIIGIIVLTSFTGYIIYYQKVLKYPKPVRKVRKYRKTLNKSNPPNISITSRESAFKSSYKTKSKYHGHFNRKYSSKSRVYKEPFSSKSKHDKENYLSILLILILSLQFFFPVLSFYNQKSDINNDNNYCLSVLQLGESQQWLRESHEKQLIKNSEFDDSEDWEMKINGKSEDLKAEIYNGEAKYKIIGNESQITWNITDPTNDGWILIENDYNITTPDETEINENGWRVKHYWEEDPDQFVIAQWQKNYSLNNLGIDLNDYTITSALFEIWINGTVQAVGSDPNFPQVDGVDRPGDSKLSDIALGDLADYFVLISDENRNRKFKITSYQDKELGEDTAGTFDFLNDTKLTPITQESLIYYLNQILEGNNYNFSIILGIQVWCEDNGAPTDHDEFENLYFKNMSLSLTLDKKISKFSSITWKYEGDKIKSEGKKIDIKDASLNFDYKINKKWASEISPNSEIKIYINDDEHSETVKLTEAEISLEDLEDDFDVTELIPDDEEIELEIQVFIADDLILDDEFIISIDNVELDISYDLITVIDQMILLPIIIGILIATGGLLAYFIYYQRVLKYPKPVRKIRKYRKTLKKQNDPKVNIIGRTEAFKEKFNAKIKASKLSPFKERQAGKNEKEEKIDKIDLKRLTQ
ncbi:MAG: hypothetical protein EU539_02580 [Promethearchaeota archaeon]|nr:MAG: hypothetical protein EU539_02580 [Candidatus Lokiarchaeota archaeon]